MAQKLVKYISLEEFRKVLKEEPEKKYKLAYVLGFGSGLRLSEIVGIQGRKSSCCKAPVEIVYEERMGRKYKRYLCTECSETYAKCNLHLDYDTWEINPLTKEQIDLQARQIKVLGKGGKERITVISPEFPLRDSMLKLLPLKISRRTIQGRFSRLTERVLGRALNFHTLRHGFGNHLANTRKIPLPMVQGFMGHTRLDTTGIYTHANPAQAIKEVWDGF